MAADTPTIPEYITVHLGAPSSPAENVRVTFPDYIKNVASSEIYPTWPENAIRANIYAQISYALNRVYTEYYRSRGYDFDITNNTQYDQAFVKGRDIFENISRIVDEIFNDYVVKQGQVQPYFTQYCAGSCAGLSQWGTVPLAQNGYTPYRILQNYYGNDISIVKNAPVKGNVPSYPGTALRLGSVGEEVSDIQRQLNRIAVNYPAIPRISNPNGIFEQSTLNAVRKFQSVFNLAQDGIVGKQTWYKIKYIYNGIKGLSELYSEGLSLSDTQRQFSRVIRRGDRGVPVRTLQYYLAFLGFFNPDLPQISVDGIFGQETYDAVLTFQKKYGLTVDGIVGRSTWNAIQDAYEGIIRTLPPNYKNYSDLIYPGYFITTGSKGNVVRQLQTYLRVIGQNNDAVPLITVDGDYGNRTKAAVEAVQRLNGLEPNGQVGPVTWNAIIELYRDYT
ncbi:MAG: peptidoglycan-binding protein [Acutalibacteraceae bacterium]|nr:peptidoglycan-binding protein [Acutalibacteraceae bacterium]